MLAARDEVRTAPLEVVRSWALSHVERVPTTAGDRFPKAAAAHFAVEPLVTGWLAERFPGDVPDVLAVDPGLHAVLMGPLPAQEATPAVLPAVAATLGRLQLASAAHREELPGLGVPSRSLEATARAFAGVVDHGLELELLSPEARRALRSALPEVLDRVAELDAIGLPQTLAHADLHLGNVAVGPGGVVLYDWSDACVSHPFLDVAHVLVRLPENPEAAPVDWLEPYLDVWRDGWADADLRRAVDLAVLVDRVFQAVTFEHLQRSLAVDGRAPLAGLQATRLTELLVAVAVQPSRTTHHW